MNWQPHRNQYELTTHRNGTQTRYDRDWIFGVLVRDTFPKVTPLPQVASGKPSKDDDTWEDLDWVSVGDPTPRPTHYDKMLESWEAIGKLSDEQVIDLISEIDQENRHGVEYKWPADHDFGKLERAINALMSELEQLPPLTWMQKIADWLSRKR
jgi:hypothetical protein